MTQADFPAYADLTTEQRADFESCAAVWAQPDPFEPPTFDAEGTEAAYRRMVYHDQANLSEILTRWERRVAVDG